MIYEENKHNFDLFLKNWNPKNWYAIYGASKDCVQLIESFDFLLKKHPFNLKYIIDDNKDFGTMASLFLSCIVLLLYFLVMLN